MQIPAKSEQKSPGVFPLACLLVFKKDNVLAFASRPVEPEVGFLLGSSALFVKHLKRGLQLGMLHPARMQLVGVEDIALQKQLM